MIWYEMRWYEMSYLDAKLKGEEKVRTGKESLNYIKMSTSKTARVRSIHGCHLVLLWISNNTAWKIYFFFVCWLYSKSVKNGTKKCNPFTNLTFHVILNNSVLRCNKLFQMARHFKKNGTFLSDVEIEKFLCTDRLHHLIQWLLFCLVGCHHDKHTTHCKIFFHQKLIQNLYIWLCQTVLSRI